MTLRSEPERMSRRASLISSTLGWRSVLLRIHAASSRAWACERPACVTWMRSRRASARVARGGSKRRATSSRQPVSFDQERSVTLRVGSRASNPGSEWRPERSPVESTTTRRRERPARLHERLPALGIEAQQQEHGQVGQEEAGDQARQCGALVAGCESHELAAQLAGAARRGRRDDLGGRVELARAMRGQRDDRPRRAVARQLLEQARHALGLARVVREHDEVEQLRARLAPLAAAQLGETLLDAAIALTVAATCVRRAPAGRRPRRGPSCLRRTGAERRPRSARRAARDPRHARRPSRRRCG